MLVLMILNRIFMIFNLFLFFLCCLTGNIVFAMMSFICGYVSYIAMKNLH